MDEEIINIEEIMRQIRQEILAKHALPTRGGKPIVPAGGKRLPPEFYEHLYHAALAYNQVGVRVYVTRINIPIIGPIIEKARAKIHELVVYYVNQVAGQQVEVNSHLLQAISVLSQALELEEEADSLERP